MSTVTSCPVSPRRIRRTTFPGESGAGFTLGIRPKAVKIDDDSVPNRGGDADPLNMTETFLTFGPEDARTLRDWLNDLDLDNEDSEDAAQLVGPAASNGEASA